MGAVSVCEVARAGAVGSVGRARWGAREARGRGGAGVRRCAAGPWDGRCPAARRCVACCRAWGSREPEPWAGAGGYIYARGRARRGRGTARGRAPVSAERYPSSPLDSRRSRWASFGLREARMGADGRWLGGRRQRREQRLGHGRLYSLGLCRQAWSTARWETGACRREGRVRFDGPARAHRPSGHWLAVRWRLELGRHVTQDRLAGGVGASRATAG